MLEYTIVDEFENLVENELRKITQKGDVTLSEIENAKNAVCLLEKLEHYMSGEPEDMEGGMSRTGRSGRYPMWPNSYARRRNPMNGQYTSRDSIGEVRYRSFGNRNSYHGDQDEMINRLEMMKDEAMSDQDRMAIDECIRKLMK